MSTRIELAKQLIDKAKELNDDKLLEMALSLLNEEKVVEKEEVKTKEKKPRGRKKKVIAAEPPKQERPPVRDTSSFIAPVRPEGTHAKGKKIIKDGKEYTLTRKEPIVLKQKFFDDGRTDKNDPINEALKKVTTYTPRDRDNNPNYKKMSCTVCGQEESVPVILSYDDLDFLCATCVGRKVRENAR